MTANDTTPRTVKYATAVKRGLAASKSADKAQWIIGDLAATVDTSEYGAGTVQRFSDDIGRAYKTVLDMRKVASQYAPAERSDLNSWTIHQIFGRQDDRVKLVSSQVWTASAAKALVESRKNVNEDQPDDEDPQDNEPTVETDEEKLARLRAYRDQLIADLAKTESAITELEKKVGPPQHVHKGIPSHAETEPRTDCPTCQANGVTPMPAPRNSRSRSRKTA
jgi:hypothetical protein